MKRLVFLFLLSINILQAQKISVGFVFAPQITSSNFKSWQQISPLHTVIMYQPNENLYFQTGYTVQYSNLIFAGGYKNLYAINLINTNKGLNFFGSGIVFPISPFNPSTVFVELGTNYSFKEKNNFTLILSMGIFVPFRKLIYEKKQGGSS